MVREVLTISVGQGGIQLGNSVWDQYCEEHKIETDGSRNDLIKDDKSFTTFFDETQCGQYVPRNICVDLEPNVINDVKRGKRQGMYHPDFLINGSEDAANNFARGFYTVGKEMIDIVNERVRKLVDNCENMQGFIMQHAIGGGTGSGLGALILESLSVDYRKKATFDFSIIPSPNQSTSIVEPYNAMMSTHYSIDNTDISFILDNEALYGLCQKKLDIRRPSYTNLNRIIAKVCSSITAALRFKGELNVDMSDFKTNLVPFPRIHFMTTSLAPIVSPNNCDHESPTVRAITDFCLQPDNFLVKYDDFDVIEDKYMAVSLSYRGDVNGQEANKSIQWARQNGKLNFVEWMPTGFKLGLNDQVPAPVDGDDMATFGRSAVMIGNNTAVIRVFTNRMCKKYDMMYSQRAYVHWYVGEGMEEGEFSEAREDLGFLEQDFQDVLMDDNSETSSADEF